MENFKINLDRPEPDRSKIQVKKDFKSFHSSHFPKPNLFHSKWFWGVSGIASIALVVTITLTSFKYNQPSELAQTNQLEKSSIQMEDSFLSSSPKLEVQAKEEIQNTPGSEENNLSTIKEDAKVQGLEKESTKEDLSEVKEEENKSVSPELFRIDFSASDFPDLEVGNNLFYFDNSVQKTPSEVFTHEWEGVELERSSNGIILKLTRGLKVEKYKVKQYEN